MSVRVVKLMLKEPPCAGKIGPLEFLSQMLFYQLGICRTTAIAKTVFTKEMFSTVSTVSFRLGLS